MVARRPQEGHSLSGRAEFLRGKDGHPAMAQADLRPEVDACPAAPSLASKKHPTHLSVYRPTRQTLLVLQSLRLTAPVSCPSGTGKRGEGGTTSLEVEPVARHPREGSARLPYARGRQCRPPQLACGWKTARQALC